MNDTDAKYCVRDTASGYAVYRGDGSYAEFLDFDAASKAARMLSNGERHERDYEWAGGLVMTNFSPPE